MRFVKNQEVKLKPLNCCLTRDDCFDLTCLAHIYNNWLRYDKIIFRDCTRLPNDIYNIEYLQIVNNINSQKARVRDIDIDTNIKII